MSVKKTDWKAYARHPLSAEYEDLSGEAFESFVENLCTIGNVNERKIVLFDGQILDGWQLQRACLQAGIQPKYQTLPDGIDADAYVRTVNDHRRHESQAKAVKRITERRQRIAAARVAGQSIATIAEEENVSASTVRNDLDQSTAQGCAVEPESGTVKGKDGKKRKAKPRKSKQKKPKTLKEAIKEETADVLKDELDEIVPPGLAPVFSGATQFRAILKQLSEIKSAAKKLKESPAGAKFRFQQFTIDMDNARRTVRFDMPYCVCRVCTGQAKKRRADCPCHDAGWLNESAYGVLPKEYKK